MSQSENRAEQNGRREFLAWISAAAATGLVPHDAVGGERTAGGALPTIALGPHRISRLIVGSNPISGYSYMGREQDLQMRNYFTPERTKAFLKQCERHGINAHQYSAASKAGEVYRALREAGSRLKLIGLHSRREDIKQAVDSVRPIGIAHHGGVTDKLFHAGRGDEVHDFVKAVHDAGLLAGVSAHNPDCIQRVADEGWEVDFFMTCFYFITRDKLVGKPRSGVPVLQGPDVGYTFYKTDPSAMCNVIRQVSQPCLAFKILGAGRRCKDQKTVQDAFRFAFQNIKSTDAAIVGMYPRHFDQVTANAGYTRDSGGLVG